ncbi:ankyrin repeat-containing domain protein [Aspergillus multicolor]|uniref:ankyrin repeat domain-containing protein n=1 Tax=Aspergillus multicolor TaxID=41759 RepID=UPI003CCD19C6
MSLTSLPCELILSIADYLAPRDLNAFVRTKKEYYKFLNSRLYQQNFPSGTSMGRSPLSSSESLLTPLQLAVESWRDDTAVFLLESGANPESIYLELLVEVAELLPKTFTMFFDRGLFPRCEDKDRGAVWALQQMSHCGSVNLARMLLERTDLEIDISSVPTSHYNDASALGIAAFHGHSELVQLLLEHGATVDTRDNFNEMPLLGYLAAETERIRDVQVVKLLVEAGADVNAADSSGRTALWYEVDTTQAIWFNTRHRNGDETWSRP